MKFLALFSVFLFTWMIEVLSLYAIVVLAGFSFSWTQAFLYSFLTSVFTTGVLLPWYRRMDQE